MPLKILVAEQYGMQQTITIQLYDLPVDLLLRVLAVNESANHPIATPPVLHVALPCNVNHASHPN